MDALPRLTTKRALLAVAVGFVALTLLSQHRRLIDELNARISVDLLRVFFTREGPNQSWFLKGGPNDLRPDFFNATITYRTASDVFLPYGFFRPLDGTESAEQKWSQEEIDRKIAKKSKVAVTAVSHCETWSRRETYLDALRKHANFTSIGRCSQNLDCRSTECLSGIIDDHFFYFAFENAVCPEYVTEKFFHLNELIVP
ncbi:Alpha-(1,3)-fucosyltransferase C [Aphelenchoides fujianensis]|nr:Alpha-(1,3)-fucosyltransferase C [Aphelenchoides fujianensis]